MTMVPKEIVDLGREMFHNMPNIGGAAVAFWPVSSFDDLETVSGGKISMESRMLLVPEHCGTHLDVPRHCTRGATDVADVPLERLVLPGHLLDLTHKRNGEAITIADLEAAAETSGRAIQPGTALLVWAGVEDDWGKPGFTMEAAAEIASGRAIQPGTALLVWAGPRRSSCGTGPAARSGRLPS